MNNERHKLAWYIINGITVYRIVAAPFLVILVFTGQYDIFKWLLGISFFTDLIDGYLARKYKVDSVLGAKLDSIGDDLTVLVGIIALFVREMPFIQQYAPYIIVLILLFAIQTSYALIRYRKLTNFHTYLAKLAALNQGIFLLLTFFAGEPAIILFFVTVTITGLELIEEIILVYLLKTWQANIKGIYWVLKKNTTK